MIRTREILGQLIGNLFEEPRPLRRAESGPRGGDRGYFAGPHHVSTKRVRRLRRMGWLNGDLPTQQAVLWYQDSLRDD